MVRWDGCTGAVNVTGYWLASGGHTWFRDLGQGRGDRLILAFLADHALRGPVPRWSPGPAAPVPALTASGIAGAPATPGHHQRQLQPDPLAGPSRIIKLPRGKVLAR
jgi:hypothetical protein